MAYQILSFNVGGYRVEVGGPRISILHTKNLDVESEGLIMDMSYFDTGMAGLLRAVVNIAYHLK